MQLCSNINGRREHFHCTLCQQSCWKGNTSFPSFRYLELFWSKYQLCLLLFQDMRCPQVCCYLPFCGFSNDSEVLIQVYCHGNKRWTYPGSGVLSPDLTVQEPCIIRAEPKLSGMVLLRYKTSIPFSCPYLHASRCKSYERKKQLCIFCSKNRRQSWVLFSPYRIQQTTLLLNVVCYC